MQIKKNNSEFVKISYVCNEFMAKKTQNTVEIKNPTAKKTISLGFISESQSFNTESASNYNYVSTLSGIEMLNDLKNQTSDWYLIAFNPACLKSNQTNKALSLVPQNPKNGSYCVATTFKKGKAFKDLFLGSNAQHDLASFVLLDADTLSRFIDQNYLPKSQAELAYAVEKTCSKEYVIQIDTLDAPKTSWKVDFNIKHAKIANYYFKSFTNISKIAFVLISLIGLFFLVGMSKKAGISGDEFTQYEYSKLTANYYLDKIGQSIPIDTNLLKGQKMKTLASVFQNEGVNTATLVDPEKLMHLYGSSFDTFTTILAHFFGTDDIMGFRHFWNAIFGFFIILYSSLIVRRLTKGSWFWGAVAFAILIFTPRLFGESLNNPKDVPFALGYIMSLYYAIKVFSNFPNVRWSSILGLIVGTALGISIRIGGLLSIAIFIMYAGLKFIETIGLSNFLKLKWNQFGKWIIWLGGISLGSYLLGVYVWPYGWDQPFTNPFVALKSFTNYAGSIRQLFEGRMFDSDVLPAYYLTKYVFITLPLVSLVGFVIFLITTIIKRKEFTIEEFLIVFAAIFPILYIYINHSQVYGGLRQILFTIPCFVMVGILGYAKLQKMLKIKVPVSAILAVLLAALPAKFIFANTSLSYIYFNETIGGTKGAYGKFEMDYYLAGLRQSAEWFLENVARKNPSKKYEVLTYGMDQVKYYCRNDKNVHVGFTRFDDRGSKKWDYAIFYNAYFDKDRLSSGEFPPKGTVFSPMVDGKPMGCVIERLSLENFEGIKAIEKDANFRLGIDKLQSYLKVDPISSETQFYLANGYANLGMLDSAIICAKKSVESYPEYSKGLFSLHQFYMNLKKYDEAVKVMDQYLDSRPQDAEGYIMKAQSQLMKKDNSVMTTVNKAVELSPLDSRSYMLGAQYYQSINDKGNLDNWYKAAMLQQAKTQDDQQNSITAIRFIYESITGMGVEEFDKKFLKME